MILIKITSALENGGGDFFVRKFDKNEIFAVIGNIIDNIFAKQYNDKEFKQQEGAQIYGIYEC